jgi:hypothetical protein
MLMLVNDVNRTEARYRVTDVATMVMEELERLCAADWPTAVCAGDRNQRQTLNYMNLNTNVISISLNVTVFLMGCIVFQQTKEAATQTEENELQDVHQTTHGFIYELWLRQCRGLWAGPGATHAPGPGYGFRYRWIRTPATDTMASMTLQAHTELHYRFYGDTMGQCSKRTFSTRHN